MVEPSNLSSDDKERYAPKQSSPARRCPGRMDERQERGRKGGEGGKDGASKRGKEGRREGGMGGGVFSVEIAREKQKRVRCTH